MRRTCANAKPPCAANSTNSAATSARCTPTTPAPACVPSIHRLLRACPPVEASVSLTVEESVAGLQPMAELVTRLQAVGVTLAGPALDASAQSVLRSIRDQADTLQRALFEAGVTPEQFQELLDRNLVTEDGHDLPKGT